MSRYKPVIVLIAVVAVLALSATMLWRRFTESSLTETELRERVFATLQQEADTSFVVTGYLQMTVAITAENSRVLFPGVLDLPMGTTRARVTSPGRVSYGFDLSALRPEMIHLRGDTVALDVPPLQVFSAEPQLDQAQMETSRGWARLPITTTGTERLAVASITRALRSQGEAHLDDSTQPQLNTAETLRNLLNPVLLASGVDEPYYRIYFGESLVLEGSATARDRDLD